ncbi:hypothetical protein [Morganella morganii]|uniref:hypothetical protein n=1 Tax=Morganella morganii TaxID=582 RepID=UPI00069961B2|nr:hypothetical protein [Morganella morganii]KNZ89995.1 hypothetical protein AKG16_02045 [Morganella morganii]
MPVYPTPDSYENSAFDPTDVGFIPQHEPGVNPAPPKEELSVLGAAFRQYNILSGLLNPAPDFEEIEGYTPLNDPNEIKGYEHWATKFSDSRSPQETAWIKQQIDNENQDRQFLSESGWQGVFASFFAGGLDPVTLGSFFIPGAQGGFLARVSSMAANVGLSTAVGEVVLHQQQYTRTAEESLINTTAGALFGGMIGSASHLISAKAKTAATNEIADSLSMAVSGGSVGAQKVGETSLAQEAMRGPGWANSVMKMTPIGRAMNSEAVTVRRVAQQLAENNFTTEKNLEGIATPAAVETKVRTWMRHEAAAVVTTNSGFAKYRAQGGTGKRFDFASDVGKAMRRGDSSTNPVVQETAKALRPILDNVRDEMQAVGLLGADLKVVGALSYFPRMYRVGEILSKRDQFKNILINYWSRGNQVAKEDLDIAADEVVNKITGALRPQDFTNAFSVKLPGSTKSRSLTIPDELIEDYLESDVRYVLQHHIRDAAPNIELTREFGDSAMTKVIKSIEDEYDDLMKGNPAQLRKDLEIKFSDKKATMSESEYFDFINKELDIAQDKAIKELEKSGRMRKLSKQKKQDIEDIMAMRDRMLGIYKRPDNPSNTFIRAGNVLRNLNYLTKLGGMTVSAIPDVARAIMVHGFTKTFTAYGKWLSRSPAWKAGKEDLKKMGIGLDIVLSDRSRAIADIADGYAQRSAIEAGLDYMTGKFGNLTLMNQWNAFHKSINGINTADIILGAAKSDTRLAKLGIDESMLGRIHQEFAKHGETVDGLRISNSNKWEDPVVRGAFESAVMKDVNNTIVTPGVGDTPLWSSSLWGKHVFQFKSFIFGSFNRATIGGIQAGEAQFYYGLAMQIMLGSMTYAIKETLAGREVDWSPEKLIIEGIDRSGVLGPLMEFNNTIEKVSEGTVGLGPALGTGTQSRYASRGVLGSIAGPTFGTLENLREISSGILSGNFDSGPIRATRQLIPGQNLFWAAPILNKVEDSIK